MTIIFTGTVNMTVDSTSVLIQLGYSQAASGPPVVGSGTAVQQAAGRSIASGNMNPMRWNAYSHLLLQTVMNATTFAWIPFTTAAGASDALDDINTAAAAGDDSVTITVA